MLAHRIGQGGSCFHVTLNGCQHLLKRCVALLLAKNLQALHQRQAGVNHGGELTRKDNKILARNRWLEKIYVFKEILGLFLDRGIVDP
nr:hypothetical protein [Desulfobulbus sp.]